MFREYQEENQSYLEIDLPEWHAEIILSVGSNMIELTDKKHGFSILRTPPSIQDILRQPEVWGFPVLVPPNRICGGKCTWRGREYHFPQNDGHGNFLHGLVRHDPWKVESTGTEENAPYVDTSYTYDEKNSIFEGFPHKLKVNLRYVFHKDKLIQRLTAVNLSDSVMPFAAGFHSAFNFPLKTRTPEAYRSSKVYASVADHCWEMERETRFSATGRKQKWSGYDDLIHGKIVNRQPVSIQAPVIERELCGIPFHGAILDYPADGVKIFYRWDPKYTQTALWNGDGTQNFFCPEPMSWMSDSPNLPLSDQETGLYALEPGETWSAENQLWIAPR